MREFAIMFFTVFMAELGDKTQLSTLLFASERKTSALFVFAASASALVLASAIGVLAGTMGARYLGMVPLKLIAGLGFMILGAITVVQYYRGG